MVFKSGQMVQDTKGIGRMIKHMARGRFFRSMVTYIKDNGNRTWSMGMVSTPTMM